MIEDQPGENAPPTPHVCKTPKRLRRIEDILCQECKDNLYADLAEMAKQRQAAEVFSREFPMASAALDDYFDRGVGRG